MDSEFKFDLQQINTMKVSGLAAYVQRPPKDRIAWILAQGIWLPDWRPKKWATQVQLIELTWESFETVQQYEAEQLDFEPWDYYMVTAHQMFLTDDVREVEKFFAEYTDKPEFVQHPDRVDCPHEFSNEELTDDLPVIWNFKRRSVVRTLLDLKSEGLTVTWQDGTSTTTGQIGQISVNHFEMESAAGKQWLWLGPSNDLRITTVEPDGYIRSHWWNTCRRVAYCHSGLPVWSEAAGGWIVLDQSQD